MTTRHPVLDLGLTVTKASRKVTVGLAARDAVAANLRSFHMTFDGVSHDFTWEAGNAGSVTFTALPGAHTLSIDFGGMLPAGVLTLPEQTTSIRAPLPRLVDSGTAEPVTQATIWDTKDVPVNLSNLFASLFCFNPQLTSLDGTFAGLTALQSVPESLLFGLHELTSLKGMFADSGLVSISGQFLNGCPLAQDFTSMFEDCKALTALPAEFFAATHEAQIFDRLCARSGLASIPGAIFAGTRTGGSFVQTFAHTMVRNIPVGLINDLYPSNVDGMIEPFERMSHDPVNLKTAASIPQDFADATRDAIGVPTLSGKSSPRL